MLKFGCDSMVAVTGAPAGGGIWNMSPFKQVDMPPKGVVTSFRRQRREDRSWRNSRCTIEYSSIITRATGAKPAMSASVSAL